MILKSKNKRKIKNYDSRTKIVQRINRWFFNTYLKDFAKYVIETRALQVYMMVYELVQEKIVYAAITGTIKNGKKSLTALLGDTMKLIFAWR